MRRELPTMWHIQSWHLQPFRAAPFFLWTVLGGKHIKCSLWKILLLGILKILLLGGACFSQEKLNEHLYAHSFYQGSINSPCRNKAPVHGNCPFPSNKNSCISPCRDHTKFFKKLNITFKLKLDELQFLKLIQKQTSIILKSSQVFLWDKGPKWYNAL